MFTANNIISFIGVIAFVGACSQPEPTPITPEPILNKYGETTGCRQPDGSITDVTGSNYAEGRRNPCEPTGCVDGYTVGADQVPCRPPYRGGNDSEGGGNNPTTGSGLN